MEDQEEQESDSIGTGCHRWLGQTVYYDNAYKWRLSPLVKGKAFYFVSTIQCVK